MRLLRKRETANTVMQYFAGCAIVTFIWRFTACSISENRGQTVVGILANANENGSTTSFPAVKSAAPAQTFLVENLPRTEQSIREPRGTEQSEQEPKCKININLDLVFPDKSKLWIQIGTWLNPITPPADTGMIAFEPELSTVTQLLPNRQENVYFIPAAVSEKSGIAIFGGGINAGQSSSLNVRQTSYALPPEIAFTSR